jgi:hypothetical protein
MASGDLAMGGGDMSGGADMTVPPDLNGACMKASVLTFNNNVATATGDTTPLANNTSSSNCGGGLGPDTVFSFTLAQAQTVDAVLTPDANSPNYDPVLSIRAVCTSEDPADEVTCNELGPAMTIPVEAILQPGTYFLWVDGFNGTFGAFSLQVTLSPPPVPPANESCAATQPLPAFVNNTTNATGDLRAAVDDAAGSCGGMGGGDAVYSFTTTAPQSVTAVLNADMSSPSYTPVVYLRTTCASAAPADEVSCTLGNIGADATAQVGYLPAGTYYVWVDGDGFATSGKFSLDVTLGAPGAMNDSCFGGAQALVFQNGTSTVAVDTTAAFNDTTSPNCGGITGGDLVYSVTLAQPQRVTATITPDMASPTFDPVISIRTACGDQASEVTCNELGAGMAASTNQILQPGTYYLWVDGFSGSSGKGSLVVTLAPPPANESCAMPTPVALGANVMDTTSGDADDIGAAISMACDPFMQGNYPGNDLVYSYTAAANGMVNVTLTPDMNWDPALYVLPGMCTADGSTCTQISDNNGAGTPEMLTINAVAGTTYYIVVDSYAFGEAGPFALTLQ